jgi:O-antigen/teichoic acid export membrane protein
MTTTRPGARRIAGALGTVGGALGVSSLLSYALLALVARWLTEAQYAVFLSTWGLVFGLGSVLSVVEQEVSRYAAEARGRRGRVPRGAVQVLVLCGALALLTVLVVAASPLGSSVLGGLRSLAVLACVSTAGFAVQFFVRGVLVGTGLLRPYGTVLLLEASLRLVVAGALAAAVASDRLVPLVAAVVAGSFAWLPFVRRTTTLVDPHGGSEPWPALSRRVLLLAASSGLTACLLTGYPAVVTAVVGSTAGLATLFASISATRVPLLLLAPVQALAVPVVVHLVRDGQMATLRRYLVRGGLVLLAAAVVGAAAAFVLGPPVVALMFGARYEPPPVMVAALTASTILIAGVLLQGAALLALQRYAAVVATWGAAVVAALVLLVTWPGEVADRGVAGLVAASVVGCAVGTWALARATVRIAGPEPASGRLPA